MRIYLLGILLFVSDVTQAHFKLFTISIPKCGTHLLYKCIETMTGKKPQHEYLKRLHVGHYSNAWHGWDYNFATNHEPFSEIGATFCQQNQVKVIFIFRDPRDHVISGAHYLKRNFIQEYKHVSLEDLIDGLINNSVYHWRNTLYSKPQLKDVKSYYDQFLPWIDCPFVYVTTFERLVGSKGGGSDEA